MKERITMTAFFRYSPRILAATFAAASLLFPIASRAQDQPVYAAAPAQDQQIHGRIASIDGTWNLTLADDNGYMDAIQLQQGTIINPTGLTLAAGMTATIIGYPSGNVFNAIQINTPYTYSGPLPTPVYYGAGWWYPGFAYGYGPSFSLVFAFGGGYTCYSQPWVGHWYGSSAPWGHNGYGYNGNGPAPRSYGNGYGGNAYSYNTGRNGYTGNGGETGTRGTSTPPNTRGYAPSPGSGPVVNPGSGERTMPKLPQETPPLTGTGQPSGPYGYRGPAQPVGTTGYRSPAPVGSAGFGGTTYRTPSAPAYRAPSAPAYRAPSAPAYRAPSAPAYRAPSAPAYRAPSAPAYRAPSAPAYRAPSAPAYRSAPSGGGSSAHVSSGGGGGRSGGSNHR